MFKTNCIQNFWVQQNLGGQKNNGELPTNSPPWLRAWI